jgi:hypothetical protein
MPVVYALGTGDVTSVNQPHQPGYGGFGNTMMQGQLVPGIVVKDNGDGTANLVCFVDGNYLWWVTSRSEGDVPGGVTGVWSVTQSPPVSGV